MGSARVAAAGRTASATEAGVFGPLHPMIQTVTGLVLRTRRLTETSLIIQWLTREAGRLATVAKGAHRPKSPFRGKLDLFFLATFTFNRSPRSELHALREIELIDTHDFLRREIRFLQQASYCSALVELATEMETPIAGIFDLMLDLFVVFSRSRPAAETILAFELKLLHQLGLTPNLDRSSLSPGARAIIRSLLEGEFEIAARLKLSPQQSIELRQFLHGFLMFHLGRIPHGRGAALQL